ncbi:MAG: hypothetical protein ABWY80_02065 [Acidimicrobiia bacterium]
MKVGSRYRSKNTTVQVIVVRATDTDVVLACAGEQMEELDAPRAITSEAPKGSDDEMILLGKRYVDEETGVQVLCTAPGIGPLSLDGRPLTLAEAKLLPSSD